MKLIITLLLASMLVMEVKAALDTACTLAGTDPCSDAGGSNIANSECRLNSATPSITVCKCKARYQQKTTTTCGLLGGEACTTAAECASGVCTSSKCEGKSADNTACRENGECKSLNCYRDSAGANKCGGAGAITASVILMVLALVTSHFL